MEAAVGERKLERRAWFLGAILWMSALVALEELARKWVRRDIGAASPLLPFAVAVAAGGFAAFRGHRMHWRSARDLRAKLLSLSASLQALTGVALGAFVATCAALGFCGAHSPGFNDCFDVLLKAMMLSTPLVVVHVGLALWRSEPSALWGPLLWATGPVTLWTLGLAFMLV